MYESSPSCPSGDNTYNLGTKGEELEGGNSEKTLKGQNGTGLDAGSFCIKPYGIDWFDEIIANDPTIKAAGLDLFALDKRLDELEAIHGVKRIASL